MFQYLSPLPSLQPISQNMTLDLTYEPVGIGKLRLWLIFSHTMHTMKALGEYTWSATPRGGVAFVNSGH